MKARKGILNKSSAHVSPIQAQMEKWTLIELRRQCIMRGMPFDECLEGTVLSIQSWYLKNYPNKVTPERLDQYDAYVDSLLRVRDVDPIMFHSCFKLGRMEEDEDGNQVQARRIRGVREIRKRREKIEGAGIYTGTKKALTYECFKGGKDKKETIAIVKAQFPDAKENSISIWYNKFGKA